MEENKAFHSGMKKVGNLETGNHTLKNNVFDSDKLPDEELLARWGVLDESLTEKHRVIKSSARNRGNKELNKPLNARLLVKWHILTDDYLNKNQWVKDRS